MARRADPAACLPFIETGATGGVSMAKSLTVPFFKVPNSVFDMDLDLYQRAVLFYLCRCGNQGAKAWPSYETLASKTGMSRRRAVDAIGQLVTQGLVRRIRRTHKGKFTSNLYEVVWHRFSQETPVRSGAPGALGMVQEVHYGGARGALKEEPCEEEPSFEEEQNKHKGHMPGGTRRVSPISFKTFVERYRDEIPEAVLDCMAYFIDFHEQLMERGHPRLKPETWLRVAESLFDLDDEALGRSYDLDEEDVKVMVGHYFTKIYQDGCDYAITHFSSNGVKLVLYYETR